MKKNLIITVISHNPIDYLNLIKNINLKVVNLI